MRGRRSFDAVPISLQLNEVELARFAARRHDFPGVEIRPRLTRYYPLAESSVHAIGYVGAISEEDKKRLNMDDYAGTTLTGKSGVEYAYESQLHGNAGFQQLLVNAQGRSVERMATNAANLERKEPVSGNDLFLTIDQRVQQTAEEALRGQRAAAVAIDPAQRRHHRVRQHAGLRSEFVRSRTDARRIPRADRRPESAHVRSRIARRVSAGLDRQADFGAGRHSKHGVVTPHDTRYCRGMFRSRATVARGATGSPGAMARSTCARPSRLPATCISSTSPT